MPVRLPRPSDPDVQDDLESLKQGLKLILPVLLLMLVTAGCWVAWFWLGNYSLTH